MEYSPELLAEIEHFAYVYMLFREIALITEALLEDLQDPEHVAGKAFLTGRYKRKAELNNNVIQLTKQLSSPAMAIEHKIAEAAHLNDRLKR